MPYTSRFFSAPDGLKLHVRLYGAIDAASTIVCLPGLARTSADFDTLATALVESDPTRRVVVPDYRGRGESAWDPNPDNYDLRVESDDIQTILAALEIGSAIFVGTSRGGLHTMILAIMRPTLLQGAMLNDIGPVIEASGLARIRGYVGKLPQPRSWADAVDLLKRVAGGQFTAIADSEWDAYARTTFEQRGDTFVPRYDPALMRNLEKLDLDNVPTLWPQFEALSHVPVLVVRGANSDLLSPATLAEMRRRHPDCTAIEVPGQGHAPLLIDTPTITAIEAFVRRCEQRAGSPESVKAGLSMLD